MRKNVAKGRVTRDKKGYAVEIEGKKYYPPKGCDPIMDPILKALVEKDVEVLFAREVILAIRALERVELPFKIPPVITCYLCPPFEVFKPEIMDRIAPLITKSLLESGYLESEIVEQLEVWQKQPVR